MPRLQRSLLRIDDSQRASPFEVVVLMRSMGQSCPGVLKITSNSREICSNQNSLIRAPDQPGFCPRNDESPSPTN
jgi:hypothetical protein